MAIYDDWPAIGTDDAFWPKSVEPLVWRNQFAHESRLSGDIQTQGTPGSRWGWRWNFGDQTWERRARLMAWLTRLSGQQHRARLPDLRPGAQRGTAAGAPTLLAAAAQFAVTATLTNVRAKTNLLRRAESLTAFPLATGWTPTLATITADSGVDPIGTNTAWTMSSTGAGNTFVARTHTTTSHANRSYSFSIFLKQGTYTGTVTLRIRDGAGTEIAARAVTPTSSWAVYRLAGTFGASPAANVVLIIDPTTNAAGAGETLLLWGSELELSAWTQTNAAVRTDETGAPDSTGTGLQMRRLATGNHFVSASYPTSAHAGKTYTFSVYLKAGTLTGNVTLRLRDGSGSQIAGSSVTPTGTWTRFSVTGTFGATPAANIVVIIDPNDDAGTAGETLEYWEPQLEEGAVATAVAGRPTLKADDWIEINGQLVKIVADATANQAGEVAVEFRHELRVAASAGAAVVVTDAKGLYILSSPDQPQPLYDGQGRAAPMSVEWREVFA